MIGFGALLLLSWLLGCAWDFCLFIVFSLSLQLVVTSIVPNAPVSQVRDLCFRWGKGIGGVGFQAQRTWALSPMDQRSFSFSFHQRNFGKPQSKQIYRQLRVGVAPKSHGNRKVFISWNLDLGSPRLSESKSGEATNWVVRAEGIRCFSQDLRRTYLTKWLPCLCL